MRLMNAPFLILAVVTLVGACAATMLRGLVHCALALAIAFAGIGALYLNLGAQFLGLAQLLVYVGAIAVLIVFVILLTRGADSESLSPAARPVAGIVVATAIFASSLSFCANRRFNRSSLLSSSTGETGCPPNDTIRPLELPLHRAQ